MAGFHSFPPEALTAAGDEKELRFCVAAKIDALPFRQPCQATQTRPCESVAATGSISEPASLVNRTEAPGLPLSMTRAHRSKLPFSFCDQNTQGRPVPSMAIAGRYRSPPGAV